MNSTGTMTRAALATVALSALLAAGCKEQECRRCKVDRTVTAAPQAAAPAAPAYLDAENAPAGSGWFPLIAQDLSGWHPRSTDRPLSWKVVDGVLVNAFEPGQHGVDLITDRKFDDFEVYYEYRVPPHSNSGLYLRGRYEIQILDDVDRPLDNGSNGALYSLAAPSRKVTRPAGEWQSARARIVGNRITVILNGVKVVDNVEATRPTGGELDNKVNEPGPIMIQGDHGPIEVRRLMIHPLKP